MLEYLDDPSVLTKEKLKSELLAHNVELPSGNPTKDVYVQLYLKNLTAQNQKHAAAALDAFSSDEELPPAVVTARSRSSGRKAIRKTEKVQAEDLDVTALTDEGLRDELLKHGEDIGPIVASTRKLYEKKLQKLLDGGPGPLPSTDVQVHHNGNGDADVYSDKEDEVTEPEPVTEPVPEPEPEPEPVVVVERLTRSRGKTPVTTRTRSSQHQKRDQVTAAEEDGDPVRRVESRPRRSCDPAKVPEDLRALSDGDCWESSRRGHHRRDSPARTTTTPSRPAQPGDEGAFFRTDRAQRPETLLNTALLEDPVDQRRCATAVRYVPQSKGLVRDQSPRQAAGPGPWSPLVHLSGVRPLSFEPMSKTQKSQSGSPRSPGPPAGLQSSEQEDPDVVPDVLLRKQKQQKITGFLSSCNPPTRTGRSFRQVEKISASEQTPKVQDTDVLKELFPNDINSPTGITATCRRPIRGAAGRPVVYDDLWNDENGLLKTSSSSIESHIVHRVSSQPPPPPLAASSFAPPSSSSRVLAAAPPAGQTRAVRRAMPLWMKLTLLCIVAAFLFLVYQAMETNYSGPFSAQDAESVGESTA